jgi:UPF0716 protein FxsA
VRYLLLFFVVVPFVELYLLLWVSSLIGFWPTLALTLVTGIVGGGLAKREGLKAFQQWRQALTRGETPSIGLIQGALILLGGAFLLTPGVLTDVVGVLLLIPPTRQRLAELIRRRGERYLRAHTVVIAPPRSRGAPPHSVIETSGHDVEA